VGNGGGRNEYIAHKCGASSTHTRLRVTSEPAHGCQVLQLAAGHPSGKSVWECFFPAQCFQRRAGLASACVF